MALASTSIDGSPPVALLPLSPPHTPSYSLPIDSQFLWGKVGYTERAFTVNGDPTLLLGGSFHPPRVAYGDWVSLTSCARARPIELNCIAIAFVSARRVSASCSTGVGGWGSRFSVVCVCVCARGGVVCVHSCQPPATPPAISLSHQTHGHGERSPLGSAPRAGTRRRAQPPPHHSALLSGPFSAVCAPQARLLAQARADGLNHVQIYVFWNFHERTRGEYNFEAKTRADLAGFFRLSAAAGLFVNVRIG